MLFLTCRSTFVRSVVASHMARRSVCAKIWEMKKVTPKYVIRYGESPVNFMNGIQYLIPQKYLLKLLNLNLLKNHMLYYLFAHC